jgi:hypothetical protein
MANNPPFKAVWKVIHKVNIDAKRARTVILAGTNLSYIYRKYAYEICLPYGLGIGNVLNVTKLRADKGNRHRQKFSGQSSSAEAALLR